jgi:hypothetical protein
MSTDFMMASIAWPTDENGRMLALGAPLATALKTHAISAMAAVDEDDLETFLRVDAPEGAVRAAAEAMTTAFIDEAFVTSLPRDTGMFAVDTQREFLVTGGLSGGDEPTDSFGPIVLLDALGVTNEPFPGFATRESQLL